MPSTARGAGQTVFKCPLSVSARAASRGAYGKRSKLALACTPGTSIATGTSSYIAIDRDRSTGILTLRFDYAHVIAWHAGHAR
eukprot:2558194-Pleurochrysis_carterae.AAC.2